MNISRTRSTGGDTGPKTFAQGGRKPYGTLTQHLCVTFAQRQAYKPRIGRITERMTFGQLAAGHRLVVSRRDPPYDRILGLRGLYHDHAAREAAAGTPRNLHHELKRPLRRAEIGTVQEVVGIEYAHNRHPSEIESLGYHLRADQNIGTAALEILDYAVIGALRGGGVTVQTRHTRLGEELRNTLLDALRAETHRCRIGRAALRACAGHGRHISAIVALHTPRRLVQRERHVTVRAAHRPPAFAARDKGRETAPVLEEHHLLTPRQCTLHGPYELHVEVAAAFAPLDRPHRIRNDDIGLTRPAVTLLYDRISVFVPQCVGIALE